MGEAGEEGGGAGEEVPQPAQEGRVGTQQVQENHPAVLRCNCIFVCEKSIPSIRNYTLRSLVLESSLIR